MAWIMKGGFHGDSNRVLFYPFLRAPGIIHSNTKKWRQNQKYGYEQANKLDTHIQSETWTLRKHVWKIASGNITIYSYKNVFHRLIIELTFRNP